MTYRLEPSKYRILTSVTLYRCKDFLKGCRNDSNYRDLLISRSNFSVVDNNLTIAVVMVTDQHIEVAISIKHFQGHRPLHIM